MKLPPSASLPNPMLIRADMSAGAGYGGTRLLPPPSNVHNVNAWAVRRDPPTYDEAMAGRSPFEEQPHADVLLHDFPPSPRCLSEKSKLIGLWEAGKWEQLRGAIHKFANSPVAMESNFSSEKVDAVLGAITTWINMVTMAPPTMNRGDPYSISMDSAITSALKQLCSLHNELQKHAGQMQTFDPSFSRRFVDLATQIHAFIEDVK